LMERTIPNEDTKLSIYARRTPLRNGITTPRHYDHTIHMNLYTKFDDASRTTSSLRTNHDNEYSIQDPNIRTPIFSVFCLSLHLSPAISYVGELGHDLTTYRG
jgi:hypothetical protein